MSTTDTASGTQPTVVFDEYGFAVRENEEESSVMEDTHRCHVYGPPLSSTVMESWEAVCNDWQHHEKDSPQKLRRLLRKGLPHELRPRVWQLFLNSQTLRSQSTFNIEATLAEIYTQMEVHGVTDQCNQTNVQLLNSIMDEKLREEEESGVVGDRKVMEWVRTTRQIMMDTNRTFPTHRLFLGETPTKRSLFRLLMLYVEYNPSVGYCQGMAYVAALLLMIMEEEEDAFWALVSLFDRPKYLSGYYDPTLSKIKTHADVFVQLMKEKLPELAEHLESLGVHPLMYATTWFMCLFTTLPCWDTVLSICDLLFLEGVNVIFRTALAIMKVCSPELLTMHKIENVIPFLQHIPSRLVSHNQFIRVLWQTPVHSWEVKLFQDVVFQGTEKVTRTTGLKRSAPEEQTPQPAKKRRDEATPSTSQSLLDRIVSAITPARSTKLDTPAGQSANEKRNVTTKSATRVTLRQGNGPTQFKTPSTQGKSGTRKRKLVTLASPQQPSSEGFEMQEFSTLRKSTTISSSGFMDSAHASVQPPPASSNSSMKDGGVRRSPRLARRRSLQQGLLPSLSIVSPRSERPLQDHVQTTTHAKEHHSFRTFSTPTPHRASQKRRRSSTGSPQQAPPSPPAHSPDVELRPMKRRKQKEEDKVSCSPV